MKEAGAGDGAHLDLVANPSVAGLDDVALIQTAGEREAVVAEHVGRAVLVLGIEVFDESGLAEKEADTP